jgi:hypothetical protein
MILPDFVYPTFNQRFLMGPLFPAALVLLTWQVPVAASGEVELLTEELPWAVVGRAYLPAPLDVRVTGHCPAGGVGFSVVSGVLPPGLKLSRLGYFSGVAAQTGLFEFNVRAVNGCSWAARHFALLVTEPPKLKATPASIHLTATWPMLAYAVNVTFSSGGNNWLTAVPEHGATSRESVPRRLTEVPADEVMLRFNAAGLKPGVYTAQITISAWQARSVTVAVNLNVEENRTEP